MANPHSPFSGDVKRSFKGAVSHTLTALVGMLLGATIVLISSVNRSSALEGDEFRQPRTCSREQVKCSEDCPGAWCQEQLARLRWEGAKDAKHGRSTDVGILDLSACRLVQDGHQVFPKILRRGGSIRVLLVDPETEALRRGMEPIRKTRLRAELLLSLACWEEVDRAAGEDAVGHLEFRWCRETPRSGLLLINASREDRVAMSFPLSGESGDSAGKDDLMMDANSLGEVDGGEGGASGRQRAVERFEKLWREAEELDPERLLAEWGWPPAERESIQGS